MYIFENIDLDLTGFPVYRTNYDRDTGKNTYAH